MRPFVQRCHDLAKGATWFVPKTKFRHWMGSLIWKILPYTPWKNMMMEMPSKIGNSIALKAYTPIGENSERSMKVTS